MIFEATVEADYLRASAASAGADLFDETLAAYRRIFELARTSAHPYLVKCHNSIPDLLRDERYQAFNAARRQAFAEARYVLHPASCAVGSPDARGLVIGALLGSEPPREIENPRQVSAYAYPEQYGPRPLFARAVVDRGRVFVSGTASIVGSATVHVGDLVAQYEETLSNIRQLVDPLGVAFAELSFVVYVKRAEYLPVIRGLFAQSAEYLVCDICRPDLLIEIEATSNHG